MGVSGATLGISGRENSVHKNKGSKNLSTKAITLGVTRLNSVSSTTKKFESATTFETLHYTSTADCAKALHDHVKQCPCQQLPSQKQPKSHRWVYVTTYIHHLYKSKDHATKGPSNPLNPNRCTLAGRPIHTHHRDGDVQKQESSHEFCYPSPIKGPRSELSWLKQWRRWWLPVVL
ncbi:LOW QUALITY PROTEIN: hypothetical protein CFOL_v3_00320, partial [Cephalotus follicularis]